MFASKLRRAVDSLAQAHEALLELLAEFNESEPEPESEVLLTRSQRNRRSEQNEVLAMVPLNGAPSVPEGWKMRTGRGGRRAAKVRDWVYKAVSEYEPMTRADLSDLCLEAGMRATGKGDGKFNSSNLQSLVKTLIKTGRLKEKRGKLYLGKEG